MKWMDQKEISRILKSLQNNIFANIFRVVQEGWKQETYQQVGKKVYKEGNFTTYRRKLD